MKKNFSPQKFFGGKIGKKESEKRRREGENTQKEKRNMLARRQGGRKI